MTDSETVLRQMARSSISRTGDASTWARQHGCSDDEGSRAYCDKMLLAALQETQAATRAYDHKAQIVGVGYILALNVVLHFGDMLPTHARLGPLFFAVVWGVVMAPIFQFAYVLYPSRKRAERKQAVSMASVPEQRVFYVNPNIFAGATELAQQALKSDWTLVLARELLITSRARAIKQTRFQRGLMMAVVSFLVLAGEQFLRSLVLG